MGWSYTLQGTIYFIYLYYVYIYISPCPAFYCVPTFEPVVTNVNEYLLGLPCKEVQNVMSIIGVEDEATKLFVNECVWLVFLYYQMSFSFLWSPGSCLDCIRQEYTGHRWMCSSSQCPHPRDINMQTCLYCLDACLLNANPEKHVCAHHLRAANIGADSDESCDRPWSLWWGNGNVGKKRGGAFVLQVQEDNFL